MVIDDIKGALSRGEPVVFAMPVAQDFYDLAGDTVYSHTGPAGDLHHAMALVGYSEDRQAYRTERQFLTGLRARLARAKAGSVSAAVLRLRTEP